ncbi:class I adenylate-forming enzyme family protein [Kitasatospora sp. NPDC127111]|uniref:class I adenylate-forming enzyme family protein n=1 Tax=Kitasatospora sp. NPDC127111 TaxID=3345363 RepID=UPI0036312076
MAHTWWGDRLLGSGTDDELWAISSAPITRGELRAGVEARRRMFQERGITEGTSVVLRMTPSFTYLQVLLALWSCGAQVVLVDFRLKPAEFEPLIELVRPQYLVLAAGAGGPAAGFRQESAFEVRRLAGGRPAADGVVLVQFSSGSTGRPKVIGRPAGSVLAELDRHAAVPGIPGRGERVLLLNSVMHNMGLMTGVLQALAAGATLVVPPTFRPAEVLRLMARTEVSVVYGTPVHYDLLTRTADRPDLPSLRLAVSGGERMPEELHERFRWGFGLPIAQVYGLTEIGLIAGDLSGRCVPPEVGPPVPGVEVKLAGEELLVRMDRSPYLYDEHADRFSDCWLRTFDRFRQDPATGVLSMLGRSDSLAVVGGLKVDLTEVEAALLEHPRVTEAVVTHGEAIEAFVGGAEGLTANELTAWCRQRLSAVKIPKRFFVTRQLPRNSMGKLTRNRELMYAHIVSEPSAPLRPARSREAS